MPSTSYANASSTLKMSADALRKWKAEVLKMSAEALRKMSAEVLKTIKMKIKKIQGNYVKMIETPSLLHVWRNLSLA